jgi:tellurite methyltransferase
MAAEDRVRWDDVYRNSKGKPYPAPDPMLFDYTPPAPAGDERRALDLAAGLGQNGLWLASQGYITDVMDISRIALTRARMEMSMRNLRNINLLQVDLDDVQLKASHYHVVCVFRYLKRSLWKQIQQAVVPGGRVIFESYNLNYLDVVPAFNTEFLLHPGELADTFALWNVLHENEDDYVSQLVAVKPAGTLPTPDEGENPSDVDW